MTSPDRQGGRKYRSASVAPVILVLAIIFLATTIALARLVTEPLGAQGPPEDYCLPTTAQDCGCVSDAAARSGVTDTGDRELTAEQRGYREEEFTHDGVSSTYRVFTNGIDTSRPVGVVVRLHGDGAYEYEGSDQLASCLAAVATSYNMVLVQPLSPSDDRTWWTNLGENTRWLNALYRERISTLDDVDPELAWWMGYSGGAEMISYGLLPYAGHTITAGAIMTGGGGAPAAVLSAVPEEKKERLPLYWTTGTRDTGADPAAEFDALSAAREGAAFYRDQGFANVTTDFTRDDDHFTLDEVDVLHDVLAEAHPVDAVSPEPQTS
ncbi:hypothetical protein [Corynebacterium halotolerans]|uniref:Uncharacterized protein n=1 Tax=Corynebacterium halotolerans YIM 70093 = DSM 44683 TaxID=1121362 RepID=M1MZ73_9CORY|nr:hypothetical protein [Corynebacterium halotolerans]AGF72974.1 hypothetical protein A605_09860 [Corynebacterium halotolerans YIM 70093 = DSM 44683]